MRSMAAYSCVAGMDNMYLMTGKVRATTLLLHGADVLWAKDSKAVRPRPGGSPQPAYQRET
jgi:hypothetical protein